MAETPETRYTKSGDIHIAYQVTGKGPLDLVYVPGFVSHLEYQWEEPHTVKDLVAGSGIGLKSRGTHVLRGVPGEWPLFVVAGAA